MSGINQDNISQNKNAKQKTKRLQRLKESEEQFY